jgi:hypothetical protein
MHRKEVLAQPFELSKEEMAETLASSGVSLELTTNN